MDSEEEELQELLKLLLKKRANKDLAAKAAANLSVSGTNNEEPDEDDLEQRIMNNMLTNPAEQATQPILASLNLSTPINASPIINKKKKKSRRGLTQSKFIKVSFFYFSLRRILFLTETSIIFQPRTEEDKLYGIQEMKRYKEVKEKLRREKKRRMLKGLPPADDEDDDEDLGNLNDSGLTDSSVDIDDTIINNKFMTSSIDELDMWNKRQQEKIRKNKKQAEIIGKPYEKRRSSDFVISQKKKNKNEPVAQGSGAMDPRELKQIFRDEIRADIGKYLLPYLDESCKVGRIAKEDHYQHLINKVRIFFFKSFLLKIWKILTNYNVFFSSPTQSSLKRANIARTQATS